MFVLRLPLRIEDMKWDWIRLHWSCWDNDTAGTDHWHHSWPRCHPTDHWCDLRPDHCSALQLTIASHCLTWASIEQDQDINMLVVKVLNILGLSGFSGHLEGKSSFSNILFTSFLPSTFKRYHYHSELLSNVSITQIWSLIVIVISIKKRSWSQIKKIQLFAWQCQPQFS